MAKVIEATNPRAVWETMNMRTVATVFLYGLAVGVVTYAVYVLFEKFVFNPILCRENTSLVGCDSVTSLSGGTALVVGSFLGLILLVRERVYRPMLAVIGVAVSLWGIFALVATLAWWLAALVIVLLTATAYVLFSWLVKPVSLYVSVTAVVIAVVLARLAIG